MASLGSDSGKRGTTYRVLLRTQGGKRHTIRLGRVPKKIAETARRMIESIEVAKATGHSLERETADWVGRVSDEIHGRLARAGLVSPRVTAAAAAVTLGQHLDHLFANLGKQKPTTARNYARARRLLAEFFTRDRSLDSPQGCRPSAAHRRQSVRRSAVRPAGQRRPDLLRVGRGHRAGHRGVPRQ